jgi:antitoxin component YwqK of YwqJK toxin-antitoxin module
MKTLNAFTQFVVLVSLPLFLGGCGEKHEGVNEEELEEREGITYLKGSDTLYSGKDFKFYESGQKKGEGFYMDGKREGAQVAWHENGQMKGVGNYKDGKQDGLFVAWHENGKRRFQEDFKNGESVEGSAKAWNSRGERAYSLEEAKEEEPVIVTKPALEGVNEEELEFREGIAYLKGSDTPYTGKDFSLHENGQKKGVGNYKDGKENGLFVVWDANGRKKSEINYKDGKEDGLWVWRHENGQKGGERNYKDGVLVSRKSWNNKGEPIDIFGRRINDP